MLILSGIKDLDINNRSQPEKKETNDEEAISVAYQTVVGREPTQVETKSITAFVGAQAQSYKAAGRNDARKLALADLAQVLFGLNEFIYVN